MDAKNLNRSCVKYLKLIIPPTMAKFVFFQNFHIKPVLRYMLDCLSGKIFRYAKKLFFIQVLNRRGHHVKFR